METAHRESGWTLVELIVVLGIVAVLVSLTLPSLLGFRRQSLDMQVKVELSDAARAAAAIEVELGEYPGDPVWLAATMPELDFGGVGARSIHVVTGDVGTSQNAQILLYARSVTGDWFGLRLVREGDDAGRHACTGEEADMTLDACIGTAW
ncbi:MAG: type II secretion system GspH family protein [Actinobacteria bacterium]|nr:type II secretion system GspH family protein [Actinomycetota bacterium]